VSILEFEDNAPNPPPPPKRSVAFEPLPPPPRSFNAGGGGLHADDGGGDDDIERMIAMLESQNNHLKVDLFGSHADDAGFQPRPFNPPPPPNSGSGSGAARQPMHASAPSAAPPAAPPSQPFQQSYAQHLQQQQQRSSIGGFAPAPFANESSRFDEATNDAKEGEIARLSLERNQV
jgi:hypothetical protein